MCESLEQESRTRAPDTGERWLRLCPKCAFEGMRNELSEPYLTEEGWVQDCPVHGKLYLWGHWVVKPTPAGPRISSESREECLICVGEMELLVFKDTCYWQCPGDPLHRLSLPVWSDLAGGRGDNDELRRAMEKRAELFMAQLRAGNTEE